MDLLGDDIKLDDIADVGDDCEFALESILAEYGGHREEEGGEYSGIRHTGDPGGSPRFDMPESSEDAQAQDNPPDYRYDQTGGSMFGGRQEPPDATPPAPEEEPASEEDRASEEFPFGFAYPCEEEFGDSPEAEDVEDSLNAQPREEESEGDAEEESAPDFGGSAFFKPGYAASDEDEPTGFGAAGEEEKKSGLKDFFAGLTAPLISLLAAMKVRRENRANMPADSEEEDLGEEMDAADAVRYYGGHIKSLKLRLKIAVLISVTLAWISFGLPVAGALNSLPTASYVCLILELTIVLLGLDIFTAGIMSMVRGHITTWSLLAVACTAAAADAAVTASAGGSDWGLPFCGAAGLSMTFAIYGSILTSRGLRLSLRALVLSKKPFIVVSENDEESGEDTLLKARESTEGFLRRTEEADPAERIFRKIGPALLVLSLLLAFAAAWVNGNWLSFFRIFAALTCACAPFAAFLAFPMSYWITSRRAFTNGSAVAGWPGLRDIGAARHLIVTDRDIFPPDTISITSTRLLEGVWPEKAVSYAGSMIVSSGSCLAPAFINYLDRNNYVMQPLEEFCCNESGGLTAFINGEDVLCGNDNFMRLMGVKLPTRMKKGTNIYLAIDGVLSAIFEIKYTPVVSVQNALVSLMRTRRKPIFAIRDFNITSVMISVKFRMQTAGLDFPPFGKRYELSAAKPSKGSGISAIISREGLGPLVDLADSGRRGYLAVLFCTALSVLCCVIGMIIMFALCLGGSLDAASAANLMAYMLFWLVPLILAYFGLGS